MRSLRIATSFVLFVLVAFGLTAGSHAGHQPERISPSQLLYPSLVAAYHGAEPAPETRLVDDQKTGIREDIPEKYANRYREWKEEFLATEAGRNQWASYESNPSFTLRIVISRDNPEGAT